MREHATATPTCTIIPFPVHNPRQKTETRAASMTHHGRSFSQDDDTAIDPARWVVMVRRLKALAWRNPKAFDLVDAHIRRHYAGTLAIVDGNWKGVNR